MRLFGRIGLRRSLCGVRAPEPKQRQAMAYVIYGSKEGPGPYVWVPERNLMIPIGSGWQRGPENGPLRGAQPRSESGSETGKAEG